MHVEVSVALNFVISYLYNKLPRRRVDSFGEQLERALKKRFEGHWYPDKPYKGSGFRCIRVSGEKIDPVIGLCATGAGLDLEEVKDYLPKDLVVWIDPNEVSYRIGEKGVAKIIYSERNRGEEAPSGGVAAGCVGEAAAGSCEGAVDREVQNANRGFNPEAQCFKPIVDSLSSSLSNLSLSPSPHGWLSSSHSASVSPSALTPTAPPTPATAANQSSTSPVTSYIGRQSAAPTMTAAMFAQTKFGSTKLKNQGKRPSRLSPTELGSYLKQRSTLPVSAAPPQPGSWPNTPVSGAGNPFLPRQGPGALSPRNMRQEFFLEHQRLLFLQQAQLQSQLSAAVNPLVSQSLPQPQPHQQQQQQFHHQQNSAGLLSPKAPSDMTSPSGSFASDQFSLLSPVSSASSPSSSSSSHPKSSAATSLSSDSLQDALNWNALPPYVGLQHLLVAN